jgi:hypothetical protein
VILSSGCDLCDNSVSFNIGTWYLLLTVTLCGLVGQRHCFERMCCICLEGMHLSRYMMSDFRGPQDGKWLLRKSLMVECVTLRLTTGWGVWQTERGICCLCCGCTVAQHISVLKQNCKRVWGSKRDTECKWRKLSVVVEDFYSYQSECLVKLQSLWWAWLIALVLIMRIACEVLIR